MATTPWRAWNDEGSARDRRSVAGRHLPDPGYGRGDARNRRAADQEGSDLARQDGREPVLRAQHTHADVVRNRGEATERGYAEHRSGCLERPQGRDAG